MSKLLNLVLLILTFNSVCNAAAQYAVTDIGISRSWALDINNNGQVVGKWQDNQNNMNAFIWQNGVVTDIGVLGHVAGRPLGINDKGQVVGYKYINGHDQAFLWQDGEMLAEGFSSHAQRINNNGDILTRDRVFTWTDGSLVQSLLFEDTEFDAWNINDKKQIVGSTFTDQWTRSPVLYDNNGSITNLGSLGDSDGYATDINESGQIVGVSRTSDSFNHAFIWQNGVMTELTSSESQSYNIYHARINNNAQVVGSVLIYEYTVPDYAFIWENGVMTNLNTLVPSDSGWSLLDATSINDIGQIVGSGMYNGEMRSFILTPVPEPSSFVALLCGLGSIGGVIGWKRK